MNEAMKELKAKAAKIMSTEKAYESEKEALQAAAKQIDNDLISIWKAPADMGGKYTIVQFDNLEEAYICEYTEVYGVETLYEKLKNRNIDVIEEV